MRESMQERLAAKEWKLGSASEFLGLTPEEEAYIELRLKFADGLRKRRKSHGVTQENLAKSLKFSQSRVAKMEVGEPQTF